LCCTILQRWRNYDRRTGPWIYILALKSFLNNVKKLAIGPFKDLPVNSGRNSFIKLTPVLQKKPKPTKFEVPAVGLQDGGQLQQDGRQLQQDDGQLQRDGKDFETWRI
jgi:hypothetical protein